MAVERAVENQAIRRALTVSEWVSIGALLLSSATLIFTGGVLYGQVKSNTDEIATLKTKADSMTSDVATIKANVQFLTDLAKEERARR